MTTLNWEKNKRNRVPREFTTDDLPPAGSFADQKRCGFHPKTNHARKQNSSNVQYVGKTTTRSFDYQQLKNYVDHISEPRFASKFPKQKQEIIEIISKLQSRCLRWGKPIG